MARFGRDDDLKGAVFRGVDLSGAHISASELNGVVMRGVDINGADIDAPWLPFGDPLLVNGVDVVPYVVAELNRRFPGRELARAETPDGLREAWAALEQTWAAFLDRVATLPAETVEVSVAGEWSLSQTLRHLILATDMWLGKAVLGHERPFHPLGLMDGGSASSGHDASVFTSEQPSFADVLAARADRQTLVREFIADVTPEALAEERPNPHEPQYAETVLSCLWTILEEEWEHHRYAVRDLAVIGS